MNQMQTKHALARVDALLSIRMRKLKESRKDLPTVTVEDFRHALDRGRLHIALKDSTPLVNQYGSYARLDDVFDLTQLFTSQTAVLAAEKVAEEALKEEAQALKDKLVLGEASEALQLLETFAAGA